VQSGSTSSKAHAKRSSRSLSEMWEVALSSQLEFEDSDDLRGQEGNAQEGDCGRELDVDGISIGAMV
jgi:hypothetical protein